METWMMIAIGVVGLLLLWLVFSNKKTTNEGMCVDGVCFPPMPNNAEAELINNTTELHPMEETSEAHSTSELICEGDKCTLEKKEN